MITILLALAAAAVLAGATVAEHRGATKAASDNDGGLVRRLLRQRVWLAGQVVAVAGLLLHAAALHGGGVVVVQPLMSSGLVMALVIGALVDARDGHGFLIEDKCGGRANVQCAEPFSRRSRTTPSSPPSTEEPSSYALSPCG